MPVMGALQTHDIPKKNMATDSRRQYLDKFSECNY